MILIQSWPPHLVLAPLAQVDPPFLPWRDAGYSQADFTINLQDSVYGLWRAKEAGLVNIRDGFNLDEYFISWLQLTLDMRSMNEWRMVILIGLRNILLPLRHLLNLRFRSRKRNCRLVRQSIPLFRDLVHRHRVGLFLVRLDMFCIILQHMKLVLSFDWILHCMRRNGSRIERLSILKWSLKMEHVLI